MEVTLSCYIQPFIKILTLFDKFSQEIAIPNSEAAPSLILRVQVRSESDGLFKPPQG